jgi:paraquat-inducible protein B
MTSPSDPQELDKVPEAVVDAESKGFPVVWLLPLVAVLVGAWLVYKTMSETGPSISIRFETAEGIEQGKTLIKYRDVTVGKVDTVVLSDDLSSVTISATMAPGARTYLTENTRFWVVRPRIGVGGVSGLSTLVSGAYIAMEPSNSGKTRRDFVGLEKPPTVTSDKQGTNYRLRADKLGSISVGSPIYYRQFDVGEVTDYKLADNHNYVDVGIFVEAPHDQYIREGTRFWNVGGVNLAMDAQGIKLEMESVVALLSGGIAFETPPQLADSPLAPEKTVFALYDSRQKSLEQPITEVMTFLVRFTGGVRGLNVGAPVEFRGVRIGTVRAIDVGPDPEGTGILVPVVLINIEPERLKAHTFIDVDAERQEKLGEQDIDKLRRFVSEGLRARLQTGNLVTGQLYVDIDMFPDAEPATIGKVGDYYEIPTLPNPLEGILAGINSVLAKLEAANFEQTLTSLNELMVSTNQLVQELERDAPGLMTDARATLQSATDTLESLQGIASKDGEIGNELYRALEELRSAARSIRVMSEYLERHPEALIKGKGNSP